MVAFIVGAAVFLLGSSVLMHFVVNPPGGVTGEALLHQDLKDKGDQAMAVLLGGPGYPMDWSTSASSVDGITRLGLIESGASIRLDPTKFDALARGRFSSGSSDNGYVDYEEAKLALGLSGYDFHLRVFPSLEAKDDGTYGITGLSNYRVGYIGDYTALVPSTAAASESGVLDEFADLGLISYTHTLRTTAAGTGDLYPDDGSILKAALVPQIGSSQTETLISGSATGNTFSRVTEEDYESIVDPLVAGSLSRALAISDGSGEPSYQKGREFRTVLGVANFTGLATSTLTWYDYVDTRGAGTTPDDGDYGWVELSADGGATWYAVSNTEALRSQDSTLHPQASGSMTLHTIIVNAANCAACVNAQNVMVALHWVADNDNHVGYGWIVDDVTLSPVSSTGFQKTFERPEYDVLVIGSNVGQTAFTAAEVKYAIRDFVQEYGGRIIVLGGETNTNWLQPLFHVGIRDASPGVASPDTTHPLLTVPNELDWRNFDHGGKAWDFSGGSDEELFNMVVGTGSNEHILSSSASGAFGGNGQDGLVLLTTYLPYTMGSDEARRFLANSITYGKYHHLYLEAGPEVPTHEPVTTTIRSATMDRVVDDGEEAYTELSFILYLWRGGATTSTGVSSLVPTQPRFTGSTPADSRIHVNWSVPQSNGNDEILGYKIYRGTSTGAATYLNFVGPFVYDYNDTTVTNGVTYYYNVTATNSYGESASSNEASAVPSTTPGAPSSLSVTAAAGVMSLSWTAPASNGGSAITGYGIYRGATANPTTLLAEIGPNTTYTDFAIDVNVPKYYYRVKAANPVGTGDYSAGASADVVTAPSVPGTPVAAPGLNKIILTWTPAVNGTQGVDSYKIYRGTSSGSVSYLTTTTDPAYEDTGLITGAVRYYRVSAVYNGIEGGLSGEATGTAGGLPDAPVLPLATAGDGAFNITLNWSTPPGLNGGTLTGYRIYASNQTGTGYYLLAETGTNLTWKDAYVGSGLSGHTRYYVLTSVTTVGESAYSTEASATTPSAPSAPLNFAVSATSGEAFNLTLSWQAPVTTNGLPIAGYRIYTGNASGGAKYLLAIVGPSNTSFKYAYVNGTLASQTRWFNISAMTPAGEGANASASAATAGVPGAPTAVVAVGGSGTVNITWTPPTSPISLTAYKVWRLDAHLGTYIHVGTVDASRTWFRDTGLTAGPDYTYKVSALNPAGEGAQSIASNGALVL